MLWAAEKVRSFVAGKDRAAFDADEMLQFACIRGLEIIGEAASKVSRETRDAVDSVPWASIVNMRHRIVHAYSAINMDIVWLSVSKELPELVDALERHARR